MRASVGGGGEEDERKVLRESRRSAMPWRVVEHPSEGAGTFREVR